MFFKANSNISSPGLPIICVFPPIFLYLIAKSPVEGWKSSPDMPNTSGFEQTKGSFKLIAS